MSATLAVKILGDATSAVKAMDRTEQKAGGLSGKLGGLGKLAAGGAALGVMGMFKHIDELGYVSGKSDARVKQIADTVGVFGDQASAVSDQLLSFGESYAKATGIDPNSVKQAESTLLTFKSLATTAGQAGGAFERATQASADLSAAGFGSMESASVMLGKALEDPVKGLGALSKVGVTFTAQEQQQIKTLMAHNDKLGAQNIILKGVEGQVKGTAMATSDAGDRMSVSWQLLQEDLADGMGPAMDAIANKGSAMATWMGNNTGLVLTLTGVFLGVAGALWAVNAVMKAWSTITKIATGVQWLLNIAMRANPIILVVSLLVLLGVALVVAYKHNERFRNIVNGAWSAVKAGIGAAVGWIRGAIAWFGQLPGMASRWFGGLKDNAVAKFGELLGWVRGIPGKIGGLLSGLGGLLAGAGRSIIGGLLGGLQDKWREVTGFVSGIAGWIADHKGPLSYDAVLLKPAGRLIIGGLANAMDAAMRTTLAGTVADANAMLATIGTGAPATVAAPQLVAAGAAGQAYGRPINITIQGAVDPRSTARQLRDLLNTDARLTGQVSLSGRII